MAKVLCATCGIQTETGEEARSMQYEGATYFFCSTACLELFAAEPQIYFGGSPPPITQD